MNSALRESDPGVTVLASPKCSSEVIAECDFAGSTAAMARLPAGSGRGGSCS
jgi:quinolinate synthase